MTDGRHHLAVRKWIQVALAFSLVVGAWQIQARPASAAPASPASELYESVNSARLEAGLLPLTRHNTLTELAIERSADMAARSYFSHITPEGVTVFALLEQRGVNYQIAGENLAWNTADASESAVYALRTLLASPPHRANMLRADFTEIGIGVATDGTKLIFTLVFIG